MSINQDVLHKLQKGNVVEVLDVLKQSYKLSKSDDNKPISLETPAEEIFLFNKLLQVIVKELDANQSILYEVYRCLKNIVILNEQAQTVITDQTDIIENTHLVFSQLPQDVKLVNLILLFLINLTVNNPRGGKNVWHLFEPKLCDLINDQQHQYKSSALIYNILCKNKEISPKNKLLNNIIKAYNNPECDNEYLTFLVEILLSNKHIVIIYNSLGEDYKKLYLRHWKQLIIANLQLAINFEFIEHLIGALLIRSESICTNINAVDVEEYVLMLDIVSIISGREAYTHKIQAKTSLVALTTNLLQSIHVLGKSDNKHYVPLPTLADLERLGEDVLSHPSFGFKASCIRLIGNLAWRHKKNQAEFTKLGVLAVLLDCCNMDARNPFIMQWVIFTVRNLAENNYECQKEIASLTRRGVIDSSQLNEFGLTLHMDGEDNQIRVVPLPKRQP